MPGVVALIAYAVSGHPVTVLDAGAVAGFPCFWRMVLFTGAARVRLFVRALPCAWLVSARVVARLCGTVCRLCPALSHVAGLLLFVLFGCYCMVCVS